MDRSPRKAPQRRLEEGGNAALLHLVEENLRYLAELRATSRSIERAGPLGRRITGAQDISELVRPEMEHLVQEQAPSLVLVHNHPSGDPQPSPPDIALTKELVRAGKLLGIEVTDHVIVGHGAFVSLKGRKLLR